MLDDGIDRTALLLLQQMEKAYELGFENLDDYFEYLIEKEVYNEE